MCVVASEALAEAGLQPKTHAEVTSALGPVVDLITWPFFIAYRLGWLLFTNTSVAILLSTLSAGIFAWLSIRRSAATARLSLTYTSISKQIWDKDVIKARQTLRLIKNDVETNPENIAIYASPRSPLSHSFGDGFTTDFLDRKIMLLSILNDYEHLALGIKHGIVDEQYAYHFMRGTVLSDWETLSPLVNQYRRLAKNPQAYVEFEGLAHAWAKNRSYRSNNWRLNRSQRWLRIR